jgi:hypothetical protein
MKRFLWVISSFFLFSGCVSGPEMVVQAQPFRSKDKAILIQHFAVYPEMASQVDKEFVQQLGANLAYDIQSCLRKAGFSRPLVIAPGEPGEGDLLIKGAITRVAGGNVHQRMSLELFGFGATEVRAYGEVTDVQSSIPIAGFSSSKQSHYSWLNNELAVRENVKEIAEAISQVLIRAQK